MFLINDMVMYVFVIHTDVDSYQTVSGGVFFFTEVKFVQMIRPFMNWIDITLWVSAILS